MYAETYPPLSEGNLSRLVQNIKTGYTTTLKAWIDEEANLQVALTGIHLNNKELYSNFSKECGRNLWGWADEVSPLEGLVDSRGYQCTHCLGWTVELGLDTNEKRQAHLDAHVTEIGFQDPEDHSYNSHAIAERLANKEDYYGERRPLFPPTADPTLRMTY